MLANSAGTETKSLDVRFISQDESDKIPVTVRQIESNHCASKAWLVPSKSHIGLVYWVLPSDEVSFVKKSNA
jgi:hypothetical protein